MTGLVSFESNKRRRRTTLTTFLFVRPSDVSTCSSFSERWTERRKKTKEKRRSTREKVSVELATILIAIERSSEYLYIKRRGSEYRAMSWFTPSEIKREETFERRFSRRRFERLITWRERDATSVRSLTPPVLLFQRDQSLAD